MKKILIILTAFIFSACSALPGSAGANGYERISVEELQALDETGADYTFINVHIPLDGSIPDTDLEIPFDEIADYQDLLPQDKDEKIVIYCRSGSMGDTASQTLVDLGYTDVSNLEGGYVAWQGAGLPFGEQP